MVSPRATMRTVRRRSGAPAAVGCAITTGLVVLLSGCTATSPVELPAIERTTPPAAPSATSTPTPTPTPTLTAGAERLEVIPAASSDTDPSHPPYDVVVVTGEALVGHYTNYRYPVQVPRDDGPGQYAEGTAVTRDGQVVAYRVAPGDIYDFIAKRFHLTNDGYLLILNERRRGEAAPLYAGDVLNLSAYTLDQYGTVNGVVAHGPPPVTAPVQRS